MANFGLTCSSVIVSSILTGEGTVRPKLAKKLVNQDHGQRAMCRGKREKVAVIHFEENVISPMISLNPGLTLVIVSYWDSSDLLPLSFSLFIILFEVSIPLNNLLLLGFGLRQSMFGYLLLLISSNASNPCRIPLLPSLCHSGFLILRGLSLSSELVARRPLIEEILDDSFGLDVQVCKKREKHNNEGKILTSAKIKE